MTEEDQLLVILHLLVVFLLHEIKKNEFSHLIAKTKFRDLLRICES